MTLRITQGMMNIQLIRNLNNNLARIDNRQNQLETGRKINRPSDDPVGITYSLRYRSELTINAQYQRNLDMALTWLDFTDSMLNEAGNILHRAYELAIQGSNGTNPPEAMYAIKQEIDELYAQMVEVANSQLNGKYVFNGQKTDVRPYDAANAAQAVTDSYQIQFEVIQGVLVPINLTGNDVFGAPNDPMNTFQILKDLSNALGNNNHTAVKNLSEKIQQRMDAILAFRSEIGARVNRVELIESRLKDMNVHLNSLQAKTEDADMAELITKLKMDENVYNASLAVGARVITPSLVDFLK
jgi:flagellar hook-associated protein 3 FlgL